MRFVSSLRFQLYAIMILLAGLIIAAVSLTVTLVGESNERVNQNETVSLQRSNAYLLASLSRRLFNAENESDQTNIRIQIENTIDNVLQIEAGLRNGNDALDIEPITNPALSGLLDDLDTEWNQYIALIETYLASPQPERESYLSQIDSKSVAVFTVADRLVSGVNIITAQRQTAIQQLSVGIVIVAFISIIATVIVVNRIVQAVRSLSSTSHQLSEGDLTARAEKSRLVEISDLGLSFNNMASQIESLVSELEHRVEDAQAAQAAAERSDQVKSAFLASMSHELRTPLNSIINYSKFVVRGVMGPVSEKQEETLNRVINSGHHLLNLINDVLDMSKIESDSLTLFVEENISLKEVLENVIDTGQALLADKPIELRHHLPENLPHLRADRKRITQVYLNVFSNACKFTKQGFVELTAEVKNEKVIVTVQDTGSGIAEEDQESVFEAFRQTESGLRQSEGTGLGMPISKSLIEAHNGKIWFTSKKGEGTTFYVEIPIVNEQLQAVV